MKGHTDKSMGIVTLIVESWGKIKTTDPLRFLIYFNRIKKGEIRVKNCHAKTTNSQLSGRTKLFSVSND